MKVQNINTPRIENSKVGQRNADKSNVQFTGMEAFMNGAGIALTNGFRFLQTNQAVGANLVDLGCMVTPRSYVDFRDRGPNAGFETVRREATGTLNHSSVGAYGTIGGLAVAALSGINSQYNIKAHKIFADNATMDILANLWHKSVRSGETDKDKILKNYLGEVVDNIRVFNTDINKVDGFVGLEKADKDTVVDALFDGLKNAKPKDLISDKQTAFIYNTITGATGGESNVMLLGEGNKKAANTLKTLIGNIFNLTNAFQTEQAREVFEATADMSKNKFLNSMKSLNKSRSMIGLSVATGIGMLTQPINMYLTKKKTGIDGFVGVEGREKDKSAKFLMMKVAAGLAFAAGALATITTKPAQFASKLQFQGFMPTINQLKFVYGLTISSRLFSARDKDELRESLVKDTLGFLNLLVLGALVTKYTAKAFDKSLINTVQRTGDKVIDKMKHAFGGALKSRDEVLFPVLKANNIPLTKNGEARSFKELMKEIDKLSPELRDTVKNKLRILNVAQAVGYIYSGVILGFGIPKLNIYMTNKSEAKRKARLAEANALQQGTNPAFQNMMKPENLSTFLGNKVA